MAPPVGRCIISTTYLQSGLTAASCKESRNPSVTFAKSANTEDVILKVYLFRLIETGEEMERGDLLRHSDCI